MASARLYDNALLEINYQGNDDANRRMFRFVLNMGHYSDDIELKFDDFDLACIRETINEAQREANDGHEHWLPEAKQPSADVEENAS
ncbi:hypothetical protein OZX62_01650 [Bifidobacterium sp. ESL0690]|uniref:hypothetical protein n=1 Tax=Bifidobacterium sp. ESL0690 TaxID=2983214 RepID=UPI0023F66EFC|nr:hypothetical protein [Bifidobacterium sp. ESL0690]WEV47028.1 hypothetical protein OZX62_01650 [Bifidobacterium sp. ESL0690]